MALNFQRRTTAVGVAGGHDSCKAALGKPWKNRSNQPVPVPASAACQNMTRAGTDERQDPRRARVLGKRLGVGCHLPHLDKMPSVQDFSFAVSFSTTRIHGSIATSAFLIFDLAQTLAQIHILIAMLMRPGQAISSTDTAEDRLHAVRQRRWCTGFGTWHKVCSTCGQCNR